MFVKFLGKIQLGLQIFGVYLRTSIYLDIWIVNNNKHQACNLSKRVHVQMDDNIHGRIPRNRKLKMKTKQKNKIYSWDSICGLFLLSPSFCLANCFQFGNGSFYKHALVFRKKLLKLNLHFSARFLEIWLGTDSSELLILLMHYRYLHAFQTGLLFSGFMLIVSRFYNVLQSSLKATRALHEPRIVWTTLEVMEVLC